MEDYELDPKELGKRIAVVRKYRGVKQSEMAGHLNVKQSTYSAYEHGVITMASDKLALVGFILDVDLNWLLDLPSGKGKAPF